MFIESQKIEPEIQAIWDDLEQHLETPLKPIDHALWLLLCQAVHDYLDASETLRNDSMVLQGKGGGYYQHPMVNIKNRAFDQIMKLSQRFGLTPLDRERFTITPKENTTSLDSILNVETR